MATKSNYNTCRITALSLACGLVLVGLYGCKKERPEPAEPESSNDVSLFTPVADTSESPIEAARSLFTEPTANLKNIINQAKTWQPSFESWWGKIAPDFTLTDIEGNVHKLSNYRGKAVLVVFWTTWVPTCKLEIPHLKELRDGVPEEQLAVLGISNELPAPLKEFASAQGINHTVLSSSGTTLPAPFGQVEYVPSSFFVDSEGRIKLAVTGLVPADDAKAIVEAN